ncbi:MAG: HEPN domain-containing protein [archaeon]
MKDLDFLKKLVEEGKISPIAPSGNLHRAYMKKSEDCLSSAKVLLERGLFENSVTMSYYSMYNALTAVLLKVGVKSESHAGSLAVFKELFRDQKELYELISAAKRERIDKQYYVSAESSRDATRRDTENLILGAENFLSILTPLAAKLSTEEVEAMRKGLNERIFVRKST